MDSLIFTSDSVEGARMEEPATAKKDVSLVHQSENEGTTKKIAENETEVEVEVENVGRPVDLYKVFFWLIILFEFYLSHIQTICILLVSLNLVWIHPFP